MGLKPVSSKDLWDTDSLRKGGIEDLVEKESFVPVDKEAQGFEKIVQNVSTVFNAVAAGLLFLLMIAGAADVIGRYLFNAPINGTMERGQLMLALMVFLSWGYTQIKKGHVNVELFITFFPPRLRLITDLFTTLVTLGLCILIVWQSTIMAIETHQSGEVVFVIHWPLAPFQLIVPLGGVVMCLVLVMEIIQFVYKLKRRD
jgi:TRAP-type C4-dicarboxylate transport system permease small subunit